MQGDSRKAAIAAYKERKVVAGIYAIRCAATGEQWVGAAPDLSTIQNRIWFQLRMRASTHRGLQAAWDTHGADALSFEILERLDEETLAFARTAAMKARAKHWSETLKAPVI